MRIQNFDPDNPPAYEEQTIKLHKLNIEKHSKNNDYMFFSIFNLLCCFCWFGIPALIFSVKARRKFRSGELEEAREHAKVAKMLNIAGVIISTIILLAYVSAQIHAINKYKALNEKERKSEIENNLKKIKKFIDSESNKAIDTFNKNIDLDYLGEYNLDNGIFSKH